MMFDHVERPFADPDSRTRCAMCTASLDGKQVVRVPVEYPDEVFCDLACASDFAEAEGSI